MFIKHHHSIRPTLKTPKTKLNYFFPDTNISRWSHVKMMEDTLKLELRKMEDAILSGHKEDKYMISKFVELK